MAEQAHGNGKPALRILWDALTVVGLVALAWLAYTALGERRSEPAATQTTVNVGPLILESVKRTNKQIFIEHYNAVDITYSEAPESWLGWLRALGVRQEFVVLVRGRVPAGFDLTGFSEKDIWVSADGRRAQITLPPPTIFEENVSIDFENSRILSRTDWCPDFICRANLDAYKDVILPEGRRRLIEFAQQNGILEQAVREGQLYYERLLKSLKLDEVRVVVRGYGPPL